MHISRLFILRPVMTTLVMFAILLFGTMGYRTLPIANLPNVDFPTIQVTTTLPGASAETMASSVSMPLEKQFATIAGLQSMNSTSSLGQALVTLQFDPSRNMDGAALDVQAAITAASKQLPPQMTIPPTFSKVNPASQPILYLVVSSKTLPLYTVDDYAETLIGQRISRVSGVAQVQVNGSQVFAVRAQMDPQKLAVYGIGVDDVQNAIAQANVNMPTGTLYGKFQAFTVNSNGQLFNAKAYEPIIVAYRNGEPVRLAQLGNVIDSVQNDKMLGIYNGTPAVILAVLRQPGTNTIAVVNSIKDLLPTFRGMMPESVDLSILYDQSVSIRNSVDDVQVTLIITIALVIMVIFFFLGNLSATLIPSVALPISIVGTFAAMTLLGFSLNNLSLMALSLAVGFVVDDAIVVLENIVRHMEMGESPMEASMNGSREIGFTIVSMTLSLVAVFIPVLLMPGIVGRLFREFAVTISVAILISGFISLSLTPMLCSRFLKSKHGEEPNRITKLVDGVFQRVLLKYEKSLQFALSHRPLVVVAVLVMTIATGILFAVVPKGFMPSEDTGQIVGMTEAEQGISYEDMVKHQQALCDIVTQDPNVQSYMSSIGVGNGSPNLSINQGRILIVLKPRDQRTLPVNQVIDELAPKLATVTGIKVYLQNPPSISIGGQVTKSEYQFTLNSPDRNALYSIAPKVEQAISQLPEVQDVNSDLQIANPEVHIEVDRDKASEVGISMQQVEDALDSAYAARQISTIYTATNQYWVILEVEPKFYRNPASLHMLYIHVPNGQVNGQVAGTPASSQPNGQLVSLDTLAKEVVATGPLLVNHLGQFPSVTISFNLKPGASLGEVVAKVGQITKDMVPASISTGFQGEAQSFQDAFANMGLLLVIAVLVIYIVLGVLYESFVHPLTILSGLPSAGLGALIILLIFHVNLDIYGFLGMIMLIGIVKKNAIMMIDFALEAQREQGKSAEEAIYEACITRFRPIMMTTMAALMGSIPIAVGLGAGSETRQPLGLTVVGGLLVSQLVTLYITPVFYMYLDALQTRMTPKEKPEHEVAPPAAGVVN